MLPVKTDVPVGATRLGPGSRRSFLCRMKCRPSVQVKEEADTTTGYHRSRKKTAGADRRYCVVQCTGYMKSWASAKASARLEETEGEGDSESCNLSCLVAVGRVQAPLPAPLQRPGPPTRPVEFVSRHALDGTFLFVDQRASNALGFLPQELVSTSMYEYFHHEDLRHLSEAHRAALRSLETSRTQSYRFRAKDSGYVRLQSEWRPFKNPWTKEVEYIIAKNVVIMSDVLTVDSSAVRSDGSVHSDCGYEFLSQGSGVGGIQRIVSSHVEAGLIGQQIAKEMAGRSGECSSNGSTPSPNGLDTETSLVLPSIESPMSTSMLEESQRNSSLPRINMNGINTDSYHNAVRNNLPLSSAVVDGGASSDQEMMDVIPRSPQTAATEGNDEAAMAVIMSLLEADAGLGGPVDFSGLPWPLP